MPEIRHSIAIEAARGKIHPLVAEAAGFEQWWAEDVKNESEAVVSLGFFNGTTVYRLRRLRAEPGKVVWRCENGEEWLNTTLTFLLSSGGSSVLLDFEHGGWHEETPYFISCNTTWGALMFRLRAAAEGKRPGPLFKKNSLAY